MKRFLIILAALIFAPIALVVLLLVALMIRLEFFNRLSTEIVLPETSIQLAFTFIPKLSTVSPGDIQLSIRDGRHWKKKSERLEVFEYITNPGTEIYRDRGDRDVYYIQTSPFPQKINVKNFSIDQWCEPQADMAVDEIGYFDIRLEPEMEQGLTTGRSQYVAEFHPHEGDQSSTYRIGCTLP